MGAIPSSYYRARYYDPHAGRFMTEDPIGFEGGANFYRYVRNNPTKLRDPFGLNAGAIPIPWGRLVRPIEIVIEGVGAAGAVVITAIAELVLAPATAMDDASAYPKPTPCEDAKRKACGDQWAKDIEYCAEAYPDDHEKQQACYEIADINLQRCLDGLTRVSPRPTPRKKP